MFWATCFLRGQQRMLPQNTSGFFKSLSPLSMRVTSRIGIRLDSLVGLFQVGFSRRVMYW